MGDDRDGAKRRVACLAARFEWRFRARYGVEHKTKTVGRLRVLHRWTNPNVLGRKSHEDLCVEIINRRGEDVKVIHKYSLQASASAPYVMPKGAQILSIAAQDDQAVMWALVDTEQKDTEVRQIRVLHTGEAVDADRVTGAFLGTVLLFGGRYVVHFFEELPK